MSMCPFDTSRLRRRLIISERLKLLLPAAVVVFLLLGAALLIAAKLQVGSFHQAENSIQARIEGFPGSHRPEEALPYVEHVVIAKITGIEAARWNTSNGLRPANWQVSMAHVWMIYTPYTFEVVQVLRGDLARGASATFATLGGRVEADQIEVSDEVGISSYLVVGDQAILFLHNAEGNMVNVAPYTLTDALRIDGNQAVADCQGSRNAASCRVQFDLNDVLARVAAASGE